jgi:hypothetical protein
MNPGVRPRSAFAEPLVLGCASCLTDYIHVLFLQIQNAEHILSEGHANAAGCCEGKLVSRGPKFPVKLQKIPCSERI